MNAHNPFDAKKDWSNPYCQNSSNDPMVDALLGNAYHVVRTVYCNLGNLKLLYDFLNKYGMVLGVQSETELKAMPTSASYVRLYGFDNTNKRVVTDYLYVESDRTGVIPDDPTATGSWILVATSNSDSGGDDGEGKASPPYIPYSYNNGSAIGGETTIPVPAGTVGVPMIVINGYTNLVGYGFTYDASTLTVTLAQPLEPGDEVHLFLTGTPAVPDNPNVTDWVQINWLYNGGYASGGEQVIAIPYTFESVPAIYKNGERYYAGLVDKSYTVDAANQRILLTEPLETNDRLIITIGGDTTTLIMSDRTIQEVARSANVHENEVILSTNTTQYLNDKKVVYDVVTQKIYGLPTLPTNVYINSVSNGQLIYSPGSITVDLLPAPGSQDAVDLVQSKLDSLTASSVETNHRGTLAQDLARIDNRTSGQSIADLLANTGDLNIDTTIPSEVVPVANSHITGSVDGEVVVSKSNTALHSTGKRITVGGLLVRGDGTIDYNDLSPTYTYSLAGPDTTYFNCYAKDATMGFDLRTGADHVKVIGCRTENMTSHPNLGGNGLSAGGYGVLLNGNTDVLVLGHTSKGTNPADRHVLYLSNTSTATPNKDVRAIGVRGDFTAVSQGDKPEMHSPMVFGRNNQGVIVDASQFRGGGGGFNWTDERGTYEMISISNTQLNDIRKNDAAETCGIAFNHAHSTNPGQINNVLSVSNVQMTLTDGGKGADRSNQFPLLFNSSRYVNVNNVSFGCSGKAYGIRLIKTSYANISNIVGWTNDGTSATDAVAFIQFMQGSSNIKLSNINPQSRLKMFDGLDQVTDLQVDWVRKVRINVVSGTATASGDTWELVNSVTTGANSIVVTLKPHVTQLAVDGAMVRAASGNHYIVTGTSSKTLTISVYNINGTGVVPNTGTYSFDVVLYQ